MNLEVPGVTDTGVFPAPKSALGAALERFSSRKFLLTAAALAVGSAALLHKVIDGETYVALATLVLTSYHAGSVTDKKLNGGS